MKRERIYKNVILPDLLIQEVNALGLSKGKSGNTMKALHLISILLAKSNRKLGRRADYYSLSYGYLKKVFNGRFYDFLNPLKDNGIILCKHIASKEAGRTHVYAINPKYFRNVDSYTNLKINFLGTKEEDLPLLQRELLKDFKKFYDTLTINENKLFERLYKELDKIDKEDYKLNQNIGLNWSEKIKYSDGITTKYGTVWKLLEKASRGNANLIADKGEYFFLTVDEYKEMKKYHIESTWSNSIRDLVEGNLRAVRDKKGKRVHTNLTNLPTQLRDIILEDSDIINWDIANSQFAIYSMIAINKGVDGKDAQKFFAACQNGVIYEEVQKSLRLKSRKEAKITMFLMNFSDNNYNSVQKERFNKKFPTIAQDIEKYKLEYGSKAFPLMLQRAEADIMIDQLQPILKGLGITSATIHDSVCIKKEDALQTLEIMEEVFEKNGLKAKITTDNPLQEIQQYKEIAA